MRRVTVTTIDGEVLMSGHLSDADALSWDSDSTTQSWAAHLPRTDDIGFLRPYLDRSTTLRMTVNRGEP
jgi:hypothetical protein